MNLVNELNILLPNLDSKQKEFVENYIDEFQKIENRILSSNSYVALENSYLIIFLEHLSDQNTKAGQRPDCIPPKWLSTEFGI